MEYSIPYLNSKVAGSDMPDGLRNVVPMAELLLSTPAQRRPGVETTATLGPGFAYAGEGWEFGLEALVPLSRSAGQGLGFVAQFPLSLDYLFPETIGKPLF